MLRATSRKDEEAAALKAKMGEMAAVAEWYPKGNPYVHNGKDVLRIKQHKGTPMSGVVHFTDGSKEDVAYVMATQLIDKFDFVIHQTGNYLYDFNGGMTEAIYESVPKEDTDKWETDSGDLPSRLPCEYRVKKK